MSVRFLRCEAPCQRNFRWFLLALVFASGIAYSRAAQDQNANSPQGATQAEQRGSDALPVAVKIIASEEAKAEARDEKQHRRESAAQEKRVADATYALAGVTTVLAIFTGGLFWATYRLAKDARDTSVRQASEMQRSLKIAEDSAAAAMKSANVADLALTAVERPYILVRDRPVISHSTPRWGETKNLSALFAIKNYGKLPAAIREVHMIVDWGIDGVPNEPISDPNSILFIWPILDVNESREDLLCVGQFDGGESEFFERIGKEPLFFRLKIIYDSPFKQGYETSGCWVLNEEFRVAIFGGPAYNYTK